jgi:UDP-glucose 4-epimerase
MIPHHNSSTQGNLSPQEQLAESLISSLDQDSQYPSVQTVASISTTGTLLVTGGAGFIGSHVSRRLLAVGYRVVVLDNLIHGHPEALREIGAELVIGDVSNRSLVTRLISQHQISAILHFAGYCYVGESVSLPLKYYRNNVAGPLALLEAARESGRDVPIVFSSSCATYGNPEHLPMSEAHPQRPVNPYGRSKWMFEQILADCDPAHGQRSACLRYFNASGCRPDWGLGEEHEPETHAIPLILRAARGAIPHFEIFGTDYDTPDGTCIRDFIHVEDLAEAHLLALARLLSGAPSFACNLGTGQGTSVGELIQLAEEITGLSVPIRHGPRRAGDPAVLVADAQKAAALLGWQVRHPHVRDHIADTWAWMQSHPWSSVKVTI